MVEITLRTFGVVTGHHHLGRFVLLQATLVLSITSVDRRRSICLHCFPDVLPGWCMGDLIKRTQTFVAEDHGESQSVCTWISTSYQCSNLVKYWVPHQTGPLIILRTQLWIADQFQPDEDTSVLDVTPIPKHILKYTDSLSVNTAVASLGINLLFSMCLLQLFCSKWLYLLQFIVRSKPLVQTCGSFMMMTQNPPMIGRRM